MERLARMPEPGDEILEGAYRVRVATLEDRRVGRVEIERLEQPVEVAAEPSASGGDQ